MLTETLLDAIYEAALVPEQWQTVLDGLARQTSSTGTMLHSATDERSHTIYSDALQSFMAISSKWFGHNSRSQLLLKLPNTEFHSDADYFTAKQMAQDWLYRDYLWAHGLGYAAATWIRVPNGDNLILSIERPRATGPFSREEVAGLTALRPHLARSAMLAARMSFERIRSANQAFEAVGMPAAALRRDGTVVDCNSLFVARPDQMDVGAANKLRIASESSSRVLQSCLVRDEGNSRSIPLPGTDLSPPAVLHLVPVKRSARDIFSPASFFLVVTPMGSVGLPSADLIQGLFDLSTAEARVALAIAVGNDAASAARDLGLSPETVRYHLKSIFRKTGFGRQADLTAAIARIPKIN